MNKSGRVSDGRKALERPGFEGQRKCAASFTGEVIKGKLRKKSPTEGAKYSDTKLAPELTPT